MPRDWQAFYGSGGSLGREPVFVVRAYEHLLPAGPVLDLAGGSGRNALFLAGRGHRVLVVDYSRDALATVERSAAEDGLEIGTLFWNLEQGLPPGPGAFAGVVVSYYVQRSLLPALAGALTGGGLVLIEGYGRPEAVRRGRPDSPYYWENGELLSPPSGFSLLAAGEGGMRGRWRSWAVWRLG
ncbi:class I SAM-dependent methyltransferase [Oceanithermus sp.]